MLRKKRLFNLLELIVQTVLLVSIFTFKSIVSVIHVAGTEIVDKKTIGYMLGNSDKIVLVFFVFIFIGMIFFNEVLCLVSIFGNSTDKDGKAHIVLPIANLIYGIWIINVIPNVTDGFKVFGIVSLFIIMALAIIKRTSFVVPKEEKQSQIVNSIHEISSADELKKYKDLLDSGVITQEEFNKKKKELLGS